MGDEPGARTNFARFRQLVEQAIQKDAKRGSLYLELAAVLARSGQAAEASAAAARGLGLDPTLNFDYATVLAIRGRNADALRHLQQAVDGGFRDFVWMKIHEDLGGLATEPGFQQLLAEHLKS